MVCVLCPYCGHPVLFRPQPGVVRTAYCTSCRAFLQVQVIPLRPPIYQGEELERHMNKNH